MISTAHKGNRLELAIARARTDAINMVNAADTDYVHLVGRVVERSVQRAIVACGKCAAAGGPRQCATIRIRRHAYVVARTGRMYALAHACKHTHTHAHAPMADTIMMLLAESSHTFSTKGRSIKSGPPMLRLITSTLTQEYAASH